jgi:hypothetical protein
LKPIPDWLRREGRRVSESSCFTTPVISMTFWRSAPPRSVYLCIAYWTHNSSRRQFPATQWEYPEPRGNSITSTVRGRPQPTVLHHCHGD